MYARPGSGKSVLSNAMNLSLALQGGLERLPRIAIIDIGPSSSGLISLLQEALPRSKRHLVSYHRLRMTPDYAVNPFDTQLGCRFPTSLERSFLVNFLTLLATPLGADHPYDGIPDLAGMVVDEIASKDDLIIGSLWGGPEILYYSNRKGWSTGVYACSIGFIESCRNSGAKYFVTTKLDVIDSGVIDYLKKNYETIKSTNEYLIVKL